MICWQCRQKVDVVVRILTRDGEQSVCRKCKGTYFPDVKALATFGKPKKKQPSCPLCNTKLHLKQNSKTNEYFLACPRWPDCNYTRGIWSQ